MIRAININKSFHNKQVLRDVSVTFEQGKTNLIIGQSGSGKTVLLKSLIGLHEVDTGDIFYGDILFNQLAFKEKKEIRKKIGMLFQGGALFDSSTVLENVMYPLDMFTSMSYKEKLDRANFCLGRVNIEHANDLFPSEISGGMQKRVAIARAIALNPKYLFCDEPNSGLDPKTAIVIDKLIYDITKEFNITTIVNTHDMNSVMEIGENIAFINQGKVAWQGTNKEILYTDNEVLNNFVFASDLYRKLRDQQKK